MLIPYGSEKKNPPSYKKYKDDLFEKRKRKVYDLFNDITYTSLKPEHKAILIQELKNIALKF